VTELNRRLLDSPLGRPVTPAPEPIIPPMSDQPVRVGIRLPDSLHAACADNLTDSLRVHLSALLSDFGLDRTLAITTQRAGRIPPDRAAAP